MGVEVGVGVGVGSGVGFGVVVGAGVDVTIVLGVDVGAWVGVGNWVWVGNGVAVIIGFRVGVAGLDVAGGEAESDVGIGKRAWLIESEGEGKGVPEGAGERVGVTNGVRSPFWVEWITNMPAVAAMAIKDERMTTIVLVNALPKEASPSFYEYVTLDK